METKSRNVTLEGRPLTVAEAMQKTKEAEAIARNQASRQIEPTRLLTRAERRRAASAERKGLTIPDSLDTRRSGWDRRVLALIDKVYVDEVLVPACRAYSVSGGWALGQGPDKIVGAVTITRKTP